jgi:hypothetical protein
MFVVQYDENGVVASTGVIQDWAKPGAGFVKVTAEEFAQAVIGATKREDGTYAPPPAPPEQRLVSGTDFIQLFTPAQFKAIRDLQADDADVIFAWAIAESELGRRGALDLKHELAVQYIGMLAQKGALTAPEAARVLRGERPSKG